MARLSMNLQLKHVLLGFRMHRFLLGLDVVSSSSSRKRQEDVFL